MKTKHFVRFCAVALVTLGMPVITTFAAVGEPVARIKSVDIAQDNIVVAVEASGNFTRVTLESSTRLGRRAWEPRAVQVLTNNDALSEVTFTVPISPEIEVLRVRADLAANTLAPELYTGTTNFTLAGNNSPGGFRGGAGAEDSAAMPGAEAPESGGSSRSVVESDIWKLEGDTLFFFNQYRGLQVIDVSSPDSPNITGTYDLPGSGEQMYVINGTNVVLLASDNCSWYANGNQSKVVLLQLRDGEPHLVKELPVPGNISESRLVGSGLYIVANSYQRLVINREGDAVSEQWEWGSQVVSFDLSDFNNAQEKSRDWVRGYGNVIMATDRFLFVAQPNYDTQVPPYSSLIHCYDISSPSGDFTKLSTFDAGGIVKDKFKMHVDGDTFFVVVQIENWQSNPRQITQLNSFSLSDPRNPSLVARLKIIENEQLFATRFDGDRLYAVTFFIIDPLWIIDLSDPAAPKKVGELEIPGWSTYLHPLGDKILAIGMDVTNGFRRTAVQLFDVANPAQPALLSKVLIGDQWSSSEANWDEKAFGVLPEEKLVLVPFHSSGSEGWTQGVQLIDLETDTLVKRGVVEQNLGARRATLHRGRLLSLSSRELLTVDVTDRDKPEVVTSIQLSWAADKVHLVGDYVIEVDSYNSGAPALRIVDAADPTLLRSSLLLTNLPYLGSVDLDGKFYVLQGRGLEYVYTNDPVSKDYVTIATNPAVYLLSEFDLSALPQLPLLSTSTMEGTNQFYYGQYEPIQVRPDVLVWANGSQGGGWWWGGPIAIDAVAGAPAERGIAADAMFWPGWGGASGQFIAVDLSGETAALASETTLSGTNGWWSFGNSFTADGLLYTSHQTSEYDPDFDPPPYSYVCWYQLGQPSRYCTNDPPPGAWVTRYYLDVIDYSDPYDPLVRKPVNIPGTLIGLHHDGEVLYTQGSDFRQYYYSGDETIAASSYDGVNAHFITSLVLNQNWPRPVLGDSGHLYLGVPASTNNTNATVQVWTLSEEGRFVQTSSETLDTPAQQIEKIKNMIVLQTAKIELYDARNPADLLPIGTGEAATCYGVLLNGADGEITRGLWLPMGWYGMIHIPVAGQ